MAKQGKKVSRAHKHASIEAVSVAGLTARMAPLALQFYADSFLAAASNLPAGQGFSPAKPYLVCHALELALKAFLSLKGRSLVELAGGALGHNLATLLAEAQKQGLADLVNLDADHLFHIGRASDYYGEKVFEYPAVGEAMRAYPNMPDIDLLMAATDALVKALHQPCLTA